ncbi:unnamed protein product [Sphenostylis stenocarpa]|uniref:Uncharacterized protein n=1 Tax=Sphenostylis stenocarpa TaxID=92480 RepID=A0AA86VM84_9FABA|nr:unnamed protein product [Sphenostylis stenocarpa]
MASENINPDTVSKAVDALLKWRRSQSETQKPKLFDQDEEFVYLILTLKKVPAKSRFNPHKIPLPHSLLSPFSEQCFISTTGPTRRASPRPRPRPRSNPSPSPSPKSSSSLNLPPIIALLRRSGSSVIPTICFLFNSSSPIVSNSCLINSLSTCCKASKN